ncbi:MAG: FtsX-like permease family protein [Clostridiaceae bacterium]|nr:FtsX-like permease family protein [Clostridiaceae bacterium]
MLNIIKRQFKFHKTATLLIIISYIMSITFISVGISYLNESRDTYLDNHSGDVKNSMLLSIEFDKSFSTDKFIAYISNSKYDIKINSTTKLGNNDVTIFGHEFENKAFWKPNLLSGHYFNNEDYRNKKVAVVGSNLKQYCFTKSGKTYINLDNETFLVLGIIGRDKREVLWSRAIFMPMQCLTKNMLLPLVENSKLQVFISSSKQLSSTESDDIIKDFENQFKGIKATKISIDEGYNGMSSTINVLMVSSLVFVVSIVNIFAMTLFWIIDRRKEIAVRKVLGFTNGDVIKQILKEMLVISTLAMLLSFLLQCLLNIIINNVLKMDMTIKTNNLIISFTVIITSVLVTSIIPVKVILKIKLTEMLNL